MSILLENLPNNSDIQRYNNYSEFSIPHLNNMKLQFNDDYITCIDINIDDKLKFINNFNIHLIGKKIDSIKSIETIFTHVQSILNPIINHTFNINNDPLFLFGGKHYITKNKINRSKILEKFKTNIKDGCFNIPKELKLNHKQVFEMIYLEVEKVNKNMSYQHYIDFKDNDPYTLLFRFKYEEGPLFNKLKKLNDNFGFDYIEVIIKLDSSLYPFMAPTFEYSKPNITSDVIYNMKNSNIFDQSKWNFNISLEWLILEFAKNYESYFDKYIDITNEYPIISDIEKSMFDLFNIMGINEYEDFNIEFKIPIFTESKNKNKYWGSGTGYGHEGTSQWDINSFITKQNNINNKINNKLENLIIMFQKYKTDEHIKKIMGKFLSKQLKGTNIFDFNKNFNIQNKYITIISILKLNINYIKADIIIELYYEIKDILDNTVLINSLDNSKKETYKSFISLFTSIVNEYKHEKLSIVTNDFKINYESMVKKNQFGTYLFDDKHLYYKYNYDKISNKKNLLRLVSEISSLKKNLPINWDTSCVIRVDKKQSNMIKFIITGPKDTPYHNGVYEFHAYFPSTYPNDPPNVLLNTTDGGKVRFNPNLYASGKVCLSLLGTWSGQQGEKWNSEMSTFLQVIISIQSLIMVEEPYFNEPGYEKAMHTETGKKRAFDYKNQIRYDNLRVAILNQIKNPPQGFEEFTINHFKQKKEEILKVAEEWKNEISLEKKTNTGFIKLSIDIDNFIKELKELI